MTTKLHIKNMQNREMTLVFLFPFHYRMPTYLFPSCCMNTLQPDHRVAPPPASPLPESILRGMEEVRRNPTNNAFDALSAEHRSRIQDAMSRTPLDGMQMN